MEIHDHPFPEPSADEKRGLRRWYPRVVSSYGLTENVPWERRLDADIETAAAPVTVRPARAADVDYYGRENADVAALDRKPVSFAIFGKPDAPDDQLAAMLAEYWGCVHVSPALGLVSGRAGARTAWKLRHGRAVNAAESAAFLVALLGLESSEIRERGYVLTGLPRHGPGMSADEQMRAVFARNPPDVLIYVSFSNRVLCEYRGGLVLESMDHGRLTQTVHARQDTDRYGHGHVHWYRSTRNTVMAELDLEDYEKHSLPAVDETFRRFNPDRLIAVDGRRPAGELFETIKAKLTAMPLHRTIVPEIVRQDDDDSVLRRSRGAYRLAGYGETGETEGEPPGYEGEEYASEPDGGHDNRSNGNRAAAAVNDGERTRIKSEFGGLCPVNFYYGLFKSGSDGYSARFMGKTYCFAGPDEMRVFEKFPRQFLSVPRAGMPVRAIFYGPEALSSPAARAVGNFFGYNVIDAKYVKQRHDENEKRTYASAIVSSVLNTVRELTATGKNRSDDIGALRNAVGDWIRLHYDRSCYRYATEFEGEFQDENSLAPDDPDSGREEKLTRLRTLFESYGIDFADDLDECVRANDDPKVLLKYIRLRFLRERKTAQPHLIDIIVDEVHTRNKQCNNWIIVNAPLDFLLVKKLIDSDLHPIQIVFFRDTDPVHKLLLNDETLNRDRNKTIRKAFENVKNGIRHGTTTERVNYSEFVSKIENIDNVHEDYDDAFFLGESENGDYENRSFNEYTDNNISHNYIMEIIFPEIVERLNQYTDGLFVQWNSLKKRFLNEMDRYMDFSVIECKPDPAANMLGVLIEDTLYYIKKFLSENVHDVSVKWPDNVKPAVDKHNGDTSIYCPVSFSNGRLSAGSKEYAAVYQNRYYYMSSSKHLEAFVSNPLRYSSFASPPKLYPKPKISLLCPFGLDVVGFADNLLNAFDDFTLIDSHTVFKRNVLPENTPMVGEMYEQPALRAIMDRYFTSTHENRLHVVNSLRMYVNGKSARLSDGDWAKLNSVFRQANESVFYKNYPRNLTELVYLKENQIEPDVIVEVVAADGGKEQSQARKAAVKNWLTYQYALVKKAVEHDGVTRRITANKRHALFKYKLADLARNRKTALVKSRLKDIIEMIVLETEHGPDAVERKCRVQNQKPVLRPNVDLTMITLSNLQSRCSELTLKQKKIIIDYGLTADDLTGLDNFETLELIDTAVDGELPKAEFLLPKCLSETLELPSDAMVADHLTAEKKVLADMREFARSSGIPWITTVLSTEERDSAALCQDIARLLPAGYADDVFETTFAVNMDEAEEMLRSGEVYLSRFGHWCPVWARKESPETAVQRFYADTVEGRVFPVVHRKYVYFLSGREHRDEFALRPLRYAFRPFSAPANIALRLAVVGPPVSGKSQTALRLCDRYGLQLVCVERAVESYLAANGWTNDAQTAVTSLYNGGALSDVTLVEAVKMAVQTTRAAVCGYVLDGFPTTERQFRLFDDSGIVLHRVFAIRNGHVLDYWDGGCGHVSAALLRYRRRAWNAAFAGLGWISDRYDNVTIVGKEGGGDHTDDPMDVMDAAVRTFLGSAREYDKAMRDGRPARLAGVAVTDRERQNRMSTFLHLCPVCRVDDDCMNNNGPDNDPARGPMSRNLVQYRSFFYWVCPVHWEAFVADADRYVDLAPRHPEPMPVHVTDDELSVDPCDACKDFSAYCVVCALTRLWYPKYRRGNADYMVRYRERVYTLCSAECRCAFMCRPFAYAAYVMYVRGPADDEASPCTDRGDQLAVDDLPVPGYLEQTVAGHVGDALTTLSAMKPVYPGLSADVTAMVYLGLYMGMHGAHDDDLTAYYRDAFRRFVDTSHKFKTEVFKLKLVT